MERRPVAPQPVKTIRPFSDLSADSIASTSALYSIETITCRMAIGTCLSAR